MTVIECNALDWHVISEQLTAEQRVQLLHYDLQQQVVSTNEFALQQYCKKRCLPSVCLAESQSRGRGRNGHVWVSPDSQNIYMSLAWQFNQTFESLNLLSIAVAVVVADCLKSYGINVSLKWPNDIQVDGKKLAGILLESRLKKTNQICMVIGLGLNVHMPKNTNIDQPWTDVLSECESKKNVNRNIIAGELLSTIINLCNETSQYDLSHYVSKWRNYDVYHEKEIQIMTTEKTYYGISKGINELGALKVMIDGVETLFYAADVSLRGAGDVIN